MIQYELFDPRNIATVELYNALAECVAKYEHLRRRHERLQEAFPV